MTIELKVGAGRSLITPSVGTMLYGYAPGRPAESIHDHLRVTCIALESEQTRALLISADICTCNSEICNTIRQLISIETDIPADHILFCSTHTHSGPATSPSAGWGTVDTGYIQNILIPQTIQAAKSACSNLQSAVLGIGTTCSEVGINRRQINRDGTISLGQNPWGPYDSIMTVLCFRTPAMEPIVNLIHYCCHGTASGKNSEVTRDWSGPMVDCLEEQSGAMTVFFNGAEGDVGPRLPNGKTTGSLKLAQLLGAQAGIDAVRAWRGIKEFRAVAIKAITDEIRLPYQPLPALETARTEMVKLGNPDLLVGMDLKKYVRWQKVVNVHETGQEQQSHFHFRQTLVSIGSVVLIPFPFEVFMEITLRIRNHSSYQHTLCLSNSNGSFGYFPTRSQYSCGGYEITAARFFNAYILAEDADNAAVTENLTLIEALSSK